MRSAVADEPTDRLRLDVVNGLKERVKGDAFQKVTQKAWVRKAAVFGG